MIDKEEYSSTYRYTLYTEGKYRFIHIVNCKACGKEQEKIRGNRTSIASQHSYCSKACRKIILGNLLRKPKIDLICQNCFSSFIVHKCLKHRKFCSKECYTAYFKSHPSAYSLEERAKHMQKFSTGKESQEKKINTKIKNGTIYNLRNKVGLDWKIYVRVCDVLTRKNKKKLAASWNGLDFYSGLYIKDNFRLHYSHGDYPSLDHIKCKSRCFVEGLTPEQCCDITNLVWTTKRLNSAKNTRSLEEFQLYLKVQDSND